MFGITFFILGMCLTLYFIIDKILHPEVPAGVTTILTAILSFSGVQLMILGMIGEYLGKLFLTNNMSPQYVVREVFIHDKGDNI